MINYNTIQADVLAYLQTDSFLQYVGLFAVKSADLSSEVKRALSGLAKTNGKCGASIEIGKPFLVAPNLEAPGPEAFLEMRFLVKVQPTINNGAHGTGIPLEQISAHLVQTLLEWGAEGSQAGSFIPAENFDSPAQFDGETFEGRLVVMRAKIAFTPLIRTVTPVAADNGALTVTLTVAAPDSAAAILYTTDGTCPGYGQGTTNPAGTTQVYAAPFLVTSGAVIRSMAIAAGKLPSIVNYDVVLPG